LKSSSLQVNGHKKVCDDSGKCSIKMIDNNLTESIKDSIISAARTMKIEDSKKDKNN
jgi:hypothetical protein